MNPVAAWLENRTLPAPSAADLAAYIAHEEGVSRFAGGGARTALLRLAAIAIALDGLLKGSLEKRYDLAKAMQDSARTAVLALERLQQQEALVGAAIAWRAYLNATTVDSLRNEVDKIIRVREQMS